MPGHWLSDLTWLQAEALLSADRVLVLPLGAACKEHGPHLRLDNDRVLAEYFAARIAADQDVLIAPTLTFHYYPAFTDYPGSVTLAADTALAMTVEVCRSFSAHGTRRVYCLNTGFSTIEPLRAACGALAGDGVAFAFTNLSDLLEPVAARIGEQPGGSHADETETSMMLYIAPERVAMEQAVNDYSPGSGLSRTPLPGKAWSPSGVYGDATLATRTKGEQFVAAVLAGIEVEIQALRQQPLPRSSN